MPKPINEHPDAAAIRDWALYGPRDPQITALVERLAIERQMRLDEIEKLIVATLTAELRERQTLHSRQQISAIIKSI